MNSRGGKWDHSFAMWAGAFLLFWGLYPLASLADFPASGRERFLPFVPG